MQLWAVNMKWRESITALSHAPGEMAERLLGAAGEAK